MWVCRLPVHIGPAGCTGFTEILGEFVTSHWADRVVGPYVKAKLDDRFLENASFLRLKNLSLSYSLPQSL